MILTATEERLVKAALTAAVMARVPEEKQKFSGLGESAELASWRQVLRDRFSVDIKGPTE